MIVIKKTSKKNYPKTKNKKMGKTNKSKKFAKIKRTLNPNDKRLKSVNEKLKKKEEMKKSENNITRDLRIRIKLGFI